FAAIQKMSEQELVEVALADVKKAMQLTADPVESIVTNWSNNMPTYQITHPQTVQALEQKLSEAYSGLMLAGCSYYGVGIPDCIENGVQTANRIIERL
ncbi:protoporphyrinogen oxidase, partial [Bacillus sp. 7586-K]